MRVPAIERERTDARPVGAREEFGGRAGGLGEERAHLRGEALRDRSSLGRRHAGGVAGARHRGQVAAADDRAGELRIGVVIEVDQPGHGVLARRLDALWRPRHHRRRTAHHQRRDRADREGAAVAAQARFGLEPAERAVEPARVGAARIGQSAFQHILPVEMRPLAIGRRGRVHDRGLPVPVQPMQVRHRGIEREERIERQRRGLAVEHERLVAAQFHPVGIADRRDRREPVERAAQDDGEHARIAPLGAREPGQKRPGEQHARAAEQFTSCRAMDRHGITVSGIPAPSARASAPAGGSRRAQRSGGSRARRAARARYR